MNLKHELQQAETNESLKAKERRSAKRKAEAIAMEQVTPCFENVTGLLEWYNQNNNNECATNNDKQPSNKSPNEKNLHHQKIHTFVLLDGYHINTIEKPPYKSRGMAFVQVSTPELLCAMLTLHHSMLHRRRINVERTVGGGKNNSRLEKLKQLQQHQATHIQSVVVDIFQQAIGCGEIIPNEIDETAESVCTRHSPRVVQNTLSLYVEKNGSTYFTFFLGYENLLAVVAK